MTKFEKVAFTAKMLNNVATAIYQSGINDVCDSCDENFDISLFQSMENDVDWSDREKRYSMLRSCITGNGRAKDILDIYDSALKAIEKLL